MWRLGLTTRAGTVVVSCTTGKYHDIALAVALIYVIGGIQSRILYQPWILAAISHVCTLVHMSSEVESLLKKMQCENLKSPICKMRAFFLQSKASK